MATRLGFTDSLDAGRYQYGSGADALQTIIDRNDFTTTYPLDSLFATLADYPFFQPGQLGEQLVADVTNQQIFLVRDFTVKLIAGVWGTSGFRNGTGSQAVFSMGGLQGLTWAAARDSSGAWYITDYKNGKIRKLVEEVDDSWTVSTFITYTTDSLTIDEDDNLWVSNGSFISKITLAASVTNYAFPDGNVSQIVPFDGLLYLMTRNNAWDVIDTFDPVTEDVVRVAGMLQAEVDAYAAAHGGTVLVDGPAIDGATFHSCGIGGIESDGMAGVRIYTGGGDERQIRRVQFGEVESLLGTGLYQASQIRLGSPSSDPNGPFYVPAAYGINVATGYPNAFWFNFDLRGIGSKISEVIQTTVEDPPTGSDDAQFISQSVTTTMDASEIVSVTVTFKNIGASTWTAAALYRLGSENPRDNVTWNFPAGGARVLLASSVAPQANYAFTFNVTAPSIAGVYNFQTRMVRDNVAWFGALSPNVVVTVTGASPPTTIPVTLNLKL